MKNKWYFKDESLDLKGIVSANNKKNALYKIIDIIYDKNPEDSILDDIIEFLEVNSELVIIDLDVRDYFKEEN